ncbi:MAG: hypothetical protein H0V30_06295 [Chitinophagaceae bacterium]|nr:hypothetical protein [Chitinophagaceae bacterium]
MKAATVQDIKQELTTLKHNELLAINLRLARFKKENKELLTYILFEAHNEPGYVEGIKREIDEQMESINKSQIYFAKKSIRKILRLVNKYTRYSSSKQTEVELLIYFCKKLKISGLPLHKNVALSKLYENQMIKVKKIMKALHEDIQYDLNRELEELD